MFKKKVKFEDFNGKEREEEFYFNLSLAEMLEMENSAVGGKAAYLSRLADEGNPTKLMSEFGKIILLAIGEKTMDGQFVKSDDIRRRFEFSGAYSALFMELMKDDKLAVAFVKGVIPKDLSV